jgi:hypothetical protein
MLKTAVVKEELSSRKEVTGTSLQMRHIMGIRV